MGDAPKKPELADTAAAPALQQGLETTTTAADGVAARAREGADQKLERGVSLGRYLILEEVGAGGMGVVYAAYDPDLDRRVALKLLRRSADDQSRARLLREAQAMAKLAHPNVITVFEAGSVGDRDFIAMEFVAGSTLGEHTDGLPPEEVIDAFAQAGRGLAAAHRAGVAHRDFKPTNALVDAEGRVRVTDFGLARSVGQAGDEPTPGTSPRQLALTQTGAVLGTPAYMAPEQYTGGVIDARCDQYSFCVALYEALCGRRPFDGASFEELRDSVLSGDLPEPQDLPPRIRKLVSRGLAVDPDDRFPDMDSLVDALEARPKRRHRLLAAGSIAVVGAAAAFAFVASDSDTRSSLCTSADRQLASIWDEDVRGQLRTAFALTRVDGALATFGGFERAVDHYAESWAGAYHAACEDSRKGAAEEDVVLRMSCLQERKSHLAAMIKAFRGIDPRGIDSAIAAAQDLPAVAICSDPEALREGVDPPGAEIADQVSAVSQRLAEAEALVEAGRIDEARKVAESAEERARELGYGPLIADAKNTIGRVARADRRVRDAEEAYAEAELAAEEAGDESARARALVGTTHLLAHNSSRFDEAERYARRAEAALKRIPDRGQEKMDLVVELQRALAHLAEEQRQYDEALAILEKLLATPGLSASHEVDAMRQIGSIKADVGHLEDALEILQRAHSLASEELGSEGLAWVRVTSALSSVYLLLGREDEAIALEERARAFWDSDRGRMYIEQTSHREVDDRSSLTGRVVDAAGNPVAGALVFAAPVVQPSGRRIAPRWDPRGEHQLGADRATTAADGSFEMQVNAGRSVFAIAEHLDVGRSEAVELEPTSRREGLTLTLRETGSLRGRVVQDSGEPLQGFAQVLPEPARAGFAPTLGLRQDGSFEFERLAPGRYKLLLSRAGSILSTRGAGSQSVLIESGVATEVEVKVPDGTGTVAVKVRGEAGSSIPSAQILIIEGEHRATVGKEVNELILAGHSMKTDFWVPERDLTLGGLAPGKHTVCTVPLDGDFRDPEVMSQYDFKDLLRLAVYCEVVAVPAQGTLEYEAVVPPARRRTGD